MTRVPQIHIKWTHADDALLRDVWPRLPMRDVLEMFAPRTEDSIRTRALRVLQMKRGFAPTENQPPKWTPEDDSRIRSLWPNASLRELEDAFPSRTRLAIATRAFRLGVRRIEIEYPPGTREKSGDRLLAWVRSHPGPNLGKTKYPVTDHCGVLGKVCRICGRWKPLSMFSPAPRCGSGGHHNFCGKCGRELAKRRYPELSKHQNRRRKALLRAGLDAIGILTAKQWIAIVSRYDGMCAYCKIARGDTQDHVIPLSRGGRHEESNVVPACMRCNMAKGNRTPEEWAAGVPKTRRSRNAKKLAVP